MQLNVRLIKSIIILPFNVTIIIPCILLLTTKKYFFACGLEYHWLLIRYFIGVVLAILSLFVMFSTVRLFTTKGEGTPAPWDPPKKFIVLGPYRYVRNPMLIGVLIFLLSEVVLFGSLSIFIWFVLFLIANLFYFPFFEEKGLEKRFGESYLEYKRNVPRWIPRFTPWKGSQISK